MSLRLLKSRWARRCSFEFEEWRRAETVLKNCDRRKTMQRKISLRKQSVVLALLVVGLLLSAAEAQTESVLYSFCAQSHCTDGDGLFVGLTFDQKGNLYGTTYGGGAKTSAARTTLRAVASYSSSLPKARRQYSTASVRRRAAPTGRTPAPGWSSTRRKTCMGRPWAAGSTDRESHLSSRQKARRPSSTASVRIPTARMDMVLMRD